MADDGIHFCRTHRLDPFMTRRLSASTDNLTWAERIHEVDSAGAHVAFNRQLRLMRSVTGTGRGSVVELDAAAVVTGPAIIDAETNRSCVRSMQSWIAMAMLGLCPAYSAISDLI
ncbi:hypothetical protein SAMN05444157_0722 [Frankineae bacterium MT45]|nr:hypothetical protein SAMN05444157_0722 [Frankineae bacterium MT45]